MSKDIPQKVLDYITNKGLLNSFSYKDVWHEEHALAFTVVAKSTGFDIVSDIKSAIEVAVKDGIPFEEFKKSIAPVLKEKGWWGKKDMVDPLTGEVVKSQLGSDRRLHTIYDTNLRQAYSVGQNTRGYASDAHTHLCYRCGNSVNHREEHLAFEGITLPKDDPFWLTHMPPNGWGCNCYVEWLTQEGVETLLKDGIPSINSPDSNIITSKPIQTVAPPTAYETYSNTRKGIEGVVPTGISAGFDWNPALFGRTVPLHSIAWEKSMAYLEKPDSYSTLKKLAISEQVQEGYGQFVDHSLGTVGRQQYIVGYMGEEAIAHGIRNGTISISQEVLNASLLTKEELLALPKNLATARWYWDTLQQTLVYQYDNVRIIMGAANSTSVGYVPIKSITKGTKP